MAETDTKVLTTTSDSFREDVLDSGEPVVVDFWAEWCGPCRMVAPVLEEVADEMDGQVKVTKLNVDENQELAFEYQVSSIPTLILFKEGEVADRMLGAAPKAAIQEFINRNL